MKRGIHLKKSLYLRGIKDGFPIFLGYFAVSFTLGIAAVKAGVLPLQAVLMSATNFTSAGQFAALSVIAGAESYITMALTQLVINLRYSLMSSSLSQKFDTKMPMIHRFLIAFGNTDEAFAVFSSYDGKLPPIYCYGVISSALPGWILGTLLGAYLGNVLPTRVLSALGMALFAMFLAIILPPARKNRFTAILVLVSMVLSAVFYYKPYLKSIPSGFRIIILTVLIAGVASFIHPVTEIKEDEK